MPLINVKVKNFKQQNIQPTFSTTGTEGVANSNTLAKACLITLEATDLVGGDNNTNGYYTIGTNNITISGNPGQNRSDWLTYVNPYVGNPDAPSDAYYTTPGMPLQFTEFAPGGGGNSTTNFNSSGSFLSITGPNQQTYVNQTYDHLIGHDFWRYHLTGGAFGESYEPTNGDPATYYKVWTKTMTTSDYANETWYSDYVDNWAQPSTLVNKIVAVNAMPLNPTGFGDDNIADYVAQQGNKVFIIVILEEGVTGQDIINAGQSISIDIDGQAVFVEFTDTNPGNDTWGGDDVDDNLGNSDNDVPNTGVTPVDSGDGFDLEDLLEGLQTTVNININLNVDNSGDDTSTGTVWGDEGLTMDQVTIISDEITNITNTTNYNTFALNTNDSEEPCEDCSDGAWIDGVFYEY